MLSWVDIFQPCFTGQIAYISLLCVGISCVKEYSAWLIKKETPDIQELSTNGRLHETNVKRGNIVSTRNFQARSSYASVESLLK
jgi:hypothetical protein